MTELRFRRELYLGTAVDEAAKVFGRFADIELVEDPGYWVVKLTAAGAERERAVAGELSNYALGRTVQRRNADNANADNANADNANADTGGSR